VRALEPAPEIVWVYERLWSGSDVFHAEGFVGDLSVCQRPIAGGEYAPASREAAEAVGLRPCRHCYPRRAS